MADAVVTGGNTGIGAAIARELIARGHSVLSLSRRAPDWSDEKLSWLEVDLSDPEATRRAAGEIAKAHEVLTFVHNAGVIRPDLIEQVSVGDLTTLTHLHLGAAITLLQAFLPAMKAKSYGRVVLISSRAALGLPTRTA